MPHSEQLSEQQLVLVDLYARDPNPTKIAEALGVHRSTVYRRLDEPGVQEAIIKQRIKLDSQRNTKVEAAQDAALELISKQLAAMLKALEEAETKEEKITYTVQEVKSLMAIAKELGAMKKDTHKATMEALSKARQAGGEVDWDADPLDDETL